ncbi:MAG TPA: hypothetical protein PK728_05485 [Bacillota bacterium]|nr:hypothetical protein [Bacillota bacterium]
MRIRVSYAELKSGPGYNHQRAEAEIEVEVNGDLDKAFGRLWERARQEVKKQLEDRSPLLETLPF